jgi:hypothetical protein
MSRVLIPGSLGDNSPQTTRVIADLPRAVTSTGHYRNQFCLSQEEMDMTIVTTIVVVLALWLLGTLVIPKRSSQ